MNEKRTHKVLRLKFTGIEYTVQVWRQNQHWRDYNPTRSTLDRLQRIFSYSYETPRNTRLWAHDNVLVAEWNYSPVEGRF